MISHHSHPQVRYCGRQASRVSIREAAISPFTSDLAKLFGLFFIVVALAMMANKRNMLATINALLRDAPLMFIVDIITVALGLAMVLGHNIWSGGAVPVIVTVLGWATLLKGLAFLALTRDRLIRLYDAMHYEKRMMPLMLGTLALGLYLTIAGFSA